MEVIFEEGDKFMMNIYTDVSEEFVPIYAIINGEKRFLFNKRARYTNHIDLEDQERRKKMLVLTGGKYFKFYGFWDDPKEFLEYMIKKKFHFSVGLKTENIFYEQDTAKKSLLYYDFQGNLEEVSAAFHYRIYDTDFAQEIREAINKIFNKGENEE